MLGQYAIGEGAVGGFEESNDAEAPLLVSAYLAASYAISALVRATLAPSYTVGALVRATLAPSYTVGALVRKTISGSFVISNGANMSFTPSPLRTLAVEPGLLPFSGGAAWNMANPKAPKMAKDPNATLDYTLDWSAWLLDANDTISAHEVILVGGLVSEGSSLAGSKVTVFVSGGSVDAEPAVTIRITTASTPQRIEDRTFFLVAEER